jgi:tRNA ligase
VWLRRYLLAKQRTEEDLAKVLWDNNWTAVAELCDDEFEEHVLGYPPDLTGLHLHGINECTKRFKTMDQDLVDRFAEEWGFIRTRSIVLDSVEQVREFVEECAKDGKWAGEEVEGFVVRTSVKGSDGTLAVPSEVTDPSAAEDEEDTNDVEDDDRGDDAEPADDTNIPSQTSSTRQMAPPYAPHSPIFFKYKFQEPYLMYRDWRELTKSLLSTLSKTPAKHPPSETQLFNQVPKRMLKRAETGVYVRWLVPRILAGHKGMKTKERVRVGLELANGGVSAGGDGGEIGEKWEEVEVDWKKEFEAYTRGHGIVKTREMFLRWMKDHGEKANEDENALQVQLQPVEEKEQVKLLLVPIGVPGCGKSRLVHPYSEPDLCLMLFASLR